MSMREPKGSARLYLSYVGSRAPAFSERARVAGDPPVSVLAGSAALMKNINPILGYGQS
jgi:hypothetical protein